MKISVTDGTVAFELGVVKRYQDRKDFIGTAIGKLAQPELINAEWWHLNVKPETGLAANVVFHGDRLYQVYLLMNIPSDKDPKGWTEAHELERKALHDAWLLREIGEPPYLYPWGSISSEYDAKGCVSEIIVTYAE